MESSTANWRAILHDELFNDILPFWVKLLGNGVKFPGRVDGDGVEHLDSDKSAIMIYRMLWAFSAISMEHDAPESAIECARKAYKFSLKHFVDQINGGVWWSIDKNGCASMRKKQSYAIGFAIYAYSTYYKSTKDVEALSLALALFDKLEEKVYDYVHQGYTEALDEDWKPLEDMRLSEKDLNCSFSMNTHLHILEAYTALYRVKPSSKVKNAIIRLLDIFSEKIYSSDGHLGLFFDENWARLDHRWSFGHDIEASWLIDEAVSCIDSPKKTWAEMSRSLANNTLPFYSKDGSIPNSLDFSSGEKDRNHDWWVQAESATGLYNMFQKTGVTKYRLLSFRTLSYIFSHIIDKEKGEWFWGIYSNGKPDRKDDKAGFWKCPYHNSRMCLELMHRFQ